MRSPLSVSQLAPPAQAASAPAASVVALRPHSFRTDNALIDVWGEQIGALGVAVYCALSRYANRQTGVCWPSITTLATKLKLGRNTVKKYLRVLVQHGLISWQPRWDEAGDQTSHRYTVHPCPTSSPVVPHPPAAGGRSVADPPSVHQHGGGESATAPEQDPEQEKRTSPPIFLSALQKKQSTLSILHTDYTTTPAYAQMMTKQSRCTHPLSARYQPYDGYQRCTRCHFDAFPVLAEAGQCAVREGPTPREEPRQ